MAELFAIRQAPVWDRSSARRGAWLDGAGDAGWTDQDPAARTTSGVAAFGARRGLVAVGSMHRRPPMSIAWRRGLCSRRERA